jgi:hypothetical protein
MKSKGVIDKKIMIRLAYDRNVHYDIRYIIENKHITDSAYNLVEMMKGEK